MGGKLYLLYENASGYALFVRDEGEEIALELDQIQDQVSNFGRFSKMVSLVGIAPFRSAEDALEQINSVSEGIVTEYLSDFLDTNLPSKKRSKIKLGVSDEKLAASISDALKVKCSKKRIVLELLRGIRHHFSKFVKEISENDMEKARLGLAHSYSRGKVKFNVNRSDNHIIQSISLLDAMDKNINTFSMRIREWYAWHFPELAKIVSDNLTFAKLILVIQDKSKLTDDSLQALEDVVHDEDKAKEILEAARASMGQDISDLDLRNITEFAERVVSQCEHRQQLQDYLHEKMDNVAPNLASLIGDQVGARLIAHAGSLTNLAKYPASTVQILGAEKALFRALKTRGNTPKYGLIFHSTFIGKAGAKNKGRISRYLANKCSIASRIDSFTDVPNHAFGEKLREQVEDRLKFYEGGTTPKKNIDIMLEVQHQLEENQENEEQNHQEITDGTKKKRKKENTKGKKEKKKRKSDSESENENDNENNEEESEPEQKKKKSKKNKEKEKKKEKKEKSKKKKKD